MQQFGAKTKQQLIFTDYFYPLDWRYRALKSATPAPLSDRIMSLQAHSCLYKVLCEILYLRSHRTWFLALSSHTLNLTLHQDQCGVWSTLQKNINIHIECKQNVSCFDSVQGSPTGQTAQLWGVFYFVKTQWWIEKLNFYRLEISVYWL